MESLHFKLEQEPTSFTDVLDSKYSEAYWASGERNYLITKDRAYETLVTVPSDMGNECFYILDKFALQPSSLTWTEGLNGDDSMEFEYTIARMIRNKDKNIHDLEKDDYAEIDVLIVGKDGRVLSKSELVSQFLTQEEIAEIKNQINSSVLVDNVSDWLTLQIEKY